MKLNAKTVAAIRDPGRYADGHGLYLQVTEAGSKSWVLRYERGGRERMFGLGPLRDFGLAQARERARKARVQLADGIDPIDAKRAVKAVPTITFKQAAITYHRLHEKKWAAGHQFLVSLERHAFPEIGDMDVRSIDIPDVLRVIQPIWTGKTETASRLRRRIEAVLAWATVSKYRTGENPAVWKNRLAVILPSPSKVTKVKHHPALPFAEVATFVAALREREDIAARALEFTIYTAVRTNETLGALWGEIDLDAATWSIPGSRTKTGEPQRVPLSDAVLALLRALPVEDGNDHLFMGRSAGRGLCETAMASVMREMRPGVTVHGFRSTFRDWASETTSHDPHVCEAVLGHKIPNAVEAAYRRGDLFAKRILVMKDWAAYCDGEVGGNVIPLRAVAQ